MNNLHLCHPQAQSNLLEAWSLALQDVFLSLEGWKTDMTLKLLAIFGFISYWFK